MRGAEAEGRTHREKLNRLLGLWGADTSWRLAGELPRVPETDVTVRGLETLAVANRLDLAAARVGLESTVRALGLEKTFRFIGALDFGLAGETDPDKTNLLGPSLRLEMPIFNQGQARMARGEAQLRMAQRKFEGLAIEIRSDVRELRDRLISQRDLALFYRDEILPTRHRITAQTLAQYNAMLVGAFETFQARKEDVEAERGMIEATRDYWMTRAELERAVGGELEGETPRSKGCRKSEAPKHRNQGPNKSQIAVSEKFKPSNLDQHPMSEEPKRNDLEERTYLFARDVRALIKKLPRTIGNIEDAKQVIRSSGSVAANYIEANEALSKKDFVMRIKWCRKEAKESRLWLRLLEHQENAAIDLERERLMLEARELTLIFSAIVNKSE